MSTDAPEIFRVSWRSPLVISGAAFFVLVLLVLGIGALPFVLACGGVWLAVTLFVPAVTVRDDGLVLYCVNRLLWHHVIAVRAGKVLGQPYLMVTRHKGFRWWVPLYVAGKRPLLLALADRAPMGSPLQVCAAAAASSNAFKPKALRESD